MIQYFLWEGLPEDVRTHLRHLSSKTHPSLEEILIHYFDAYQRFESGKDAKFKIESNFDFSFSFPHRTI